MSRIVFDDEYVIVVPTFKEVVPHKHSFLHIFFLGDSRKCEEIFVTGSDMRHTMPSIDVCKVFLMVDPTSDLADCLCEKHLSGGEPVHVRLSSPLLLPEDDTEGSLLSAIHDCLTANAFQSEKKEQADPEDYRVVKLIREIREYRHLESRIDEIAREFDLSESRLSHVFKESVGISLKGYLTIARMKYAYKLVMEGKSKTHAALEAGFSSPAHLAFICKKQMGISISEVLK